jgi:hypothetical protein
LLRRALDLRAALKLGVRIGLDEIRADEFAAILLIVEEGDVLERERLSGQKDPRDADRQANLQPAN